MDDLLGVKIGEGIDELLADVLHVPFRKWILSCHLGKPVEVTVWVVRENEVQ